MANAYGLMLLKEHCILCLKFINLSNSLFHLLFPLSLLFPPSAMSSDGIWRSSTAVPGPFAPLQLREPRARDLWGLLLVWRAPRTRVSGPAVLSQLGPNLPEQGAGLQDRVQPHIHMFAPQRKLGEPRALWPAPLSVGRRLFPRRVLPQRPGATWWRGPWLHVALWRTSLWGRLPRQWHTSSHQQPTAKEEGKFSRS